MPRRARPDAKDERLNTHYFWLLVSRLGAAGLLLPMLAVTAAGLWRAGQQAAVRVWLATLALAVAVTLASKILFFGWGVGSALIDFTGVSGHALLATAILPLVCRTLFSGTRRSCLAGTLLGAALAVAVGVSRVMVEAHSWSEVLIAWSFGVAVSALAFGALREPAAAPAPWLRLAPLALLLALGPGGATYLPTHHWEVRLSLWLSGRDRPYSRQELKRPALATGAQRSRAMPPANDAAGVLRG